MRRPSAMEKREREIYHERTREKKETWKERRRAMAAWQGWIGRR